MQSKFRLLIVGFGNIGRSVLRSLSNYPDFECVGVVTRSPERVASELEDMLIYDLAQNDWKDCDADVAILCGGSKEDLPNQGPLFAKYFNTVCSFDTHAHIDNYIDESGKRQSGYYHIMDAIAKMNKHTAMVCHGWDPGTFSMMRALFTACLGEVRAEGFYGLTTGGGLSMGHSDALRTIPGVKDARQYTHAKPGAIEILKSNPDMLLGLGDMHWRECFIVAEDGADKDRIKELIVSMPNYFEPFDTTVNFISEEELDAKHSGMPHDGMVLATAEHGSMEFRNYWSSNPQGTAGILLAFARAAVHFNEDGLNGAFTSLEVPIKYLLREPSDFLKYI